MKLPARDPEILLAHQGYVRDLARSLVFDEQLAEDVAQETWLAALEHGPRDRRSLRAWLAALVRNFAVKAWRGESRRGRREAAAAKPEAVPSSEEILEREAVRRSVIEGVLALEEPYRATLILRYFEDLPPREVARRLGVPVETVRTRTKRAHEILRARLDRGHREDRRAWSLALVNGLRLEPPGYKPLLTAAAKSALHGVLIMSTAQKIAAGIAVLILIAGSVVWIDARRNPAPLTDGEPAPGTVELDGGNRGLQSSGPAVDGRSPVAESPAGEAKAPVFGEEEESVLRGIVVDASGRPVAGAEVRLTRSEARPFDFLLDMPYHDEVREIATTHTDEKGGFEMKTSARRPHDLRARAPGLADGFAEQVYAGTSVTMTLRRGGAVSGRVKRASDGALLSGVLVVNRSDEAPGKAGEVRTDAGGRYRFDGLAPGRIEMQVIPDVERSTMVSIDLEEGAEVVRDVEIAAGTSVTGVVKNQATGLPIEGAEVSCWSFLHKIVRTDGAGRYTLSGLPDHPVIELGARARGYGASAARIEPRESEIAKADFDLAPGRVAKGRVLSRDLAPVAGAYVAAVAHVDWSSSGDLASARTDADGRFEIPGLRADVTHALLVRKERLATTLSGPIDVGAPPVIDLGDIVIPPSASVSGTVFSAEGTTLADVLIDATGPVNEATKSVQHVTKQRIYGGADGRFHVVDLPAGRIHLRLYARGIGAKDVDFDLAEGETRRDVAITMGAGEWIQGRVLGPDGNGIEGAYLVLQSLEPFSSSASNSLAGGEFAFKDLEPGRRFELRASLEREYGPPEDRHHLLDVRLHEVLAGTSNLVIRLPIAAEIRGVVRTPAGEGVERMLVVATDEKGICVTAGATDVHGSFHLDVAAGSTLELSTWVARPYHGIRAGSPVDEMPPPLAVRRGVRAGDADVVLTVSP